MGQRKRYLLFGGTGFIGRALCGRLSQDSDVSAFARGEALTDVASVIRGDFAAERDFERFVDGVDCVYHLVNLTNPHKAGNLADAERDRVLEPTRRLLEACCRRGVSKFVFVSSGGTVYGRQPVLPIPETASGEPTNAYGEEKQLIEGLVLECAEQRGLPCRIVRLANPYGPRLDFSKGAGVVEMFLKKALAGEPIQLFGDGSALKDYLYVDDAARAITAIERYEGPYRVFNLGSGVGNSLTDLIEAVERAVGRTLAVERLERRSYDVSYVLDMSRFEREIGPLEARSLAEGVAATARAMGAPAVR